MRVRYCRKNVSFDIKKPNIKKVLGQNYEKREC